MKKRLLEWWASYRQQIGLLTVALIGFALITLPQLGSLIPGNSLFEQPKYLGIEHKNDILRDISFAPVKAAEFIMLKIDQPNATLLRLISAGVVLVALTAFYLLIERWHTRRVAVLTTLLFAASSYTLHHGRLANQEVLYLAAVPIFLLAGTWLKSKRHVRKLPLATVIVCLLLYLPGVWILALAGLVSFRKRLLIAWKFVGRRSQVISILLAALFLAPLLYALSVYPEQWKSWIGLSPVNSFSVTLFFDQLKAIPDQLLVHGPSDPSMWLLGTPILDIFTAAMIILGVYSYSRGHHPLRARLLLGIAGLSTVLFLLGGKVTLALLLPLLYVVAASGLARMLQSWFTVFPRNPFARNMGVVLLALVVGLTCFYHLKRYYIAWPRSIETKSAFQATQQ